MTDFDDEQQNSQLDAAIRFCGLFEAELLVELMLRFWKHPDCDDRESVNYLVEAAAEILARSRGGDRFFENIEPEDMNFVAAVWFAELSQVSDLPPDQTTTRRAWLETVRRSLPGCFCDPDDLVEPLPSGGP